MGPDKASAAPTFSIFFNVEYIMDLAMSKKIELLFLFFENNFSAANRFPARKLEAKTPQMIINF
jgi:hypothetical protein